MKQILLIMIGLSSLVSADFTRDANAIVTDSSTSLEWQDNTVGSRKVWQDALDRCESLSLGGHEDWRLPNLNELTSLIDDSNDTAISNVFENLAPDAYSESPSEYWSSTSHADYSEVAWVVGFYGGYQFYRNKSNNFNYVRCVRAGQ